jgi:hypothetical protein
MCNQSTTIPLTRGKVATIDADDAERVLQHKWYLQTNDDREYAAACHTTSPNQKIVIFMHRLILNAPKGVQVDHLDGDGLNNTRANLRLCTHAQNMANQRLRRATNTSGYKGVYWKKHAKQWCAQIKHQGRKHHLGYYRNPEDAARAYDRAAITFFGEFARLNHLDK